MLTQRSFNYLLPGTPCIPALPRASNTTRKPSPLWFPAVPLNRLTGINQDYILQAVPWSHAPSPGLLLAVPFVTFNINAFSVVYHARFNSYTLRLKRLR